ncbi:MAG: hypothetical protein AAF226_11205 [Verrucomicrobiota bacterium]
MIRFAHPRYAQAMVYPRFARNPCARWNVIPQLREQQTNVPVRPTPTQPERSRLGTPPTYQRDDAVFHGKRPLGRCR